MANKSLKDILLERDDYLCGIHVGGCRKRLAAGDATVDHIIPRNILKTDERAGTRISRDDAFKQPMCQDCNNNKKQGELDVVFSCACHSSSLTHSDGEFILSISYERDMLHDCIVKIPLEDLGGVLMVSGITGDGQFGYRKGSYGGLFRCPFPYGHSGNRLSLDSPMRAESQQPYIRGSASSITIEYKPNNNRIDSLSEIFASISRYVECAGAAVRNSYPSYPQIQQLLYELELKNGINFPAEV